MEVRRGVGQGVVLALAWMVLTFLVAPMLVVVPVSLTDTRYLALPERGLSLQHYANLVRDEVWLSAIGQSLVVAVVSTVAAVVLGTLCAVGCWRVGSRRAEAVRVLMLTPLVVPAIVVALGFYRMWIDLKLLDTFTGVILVNVVTGLPYVVITVSTSLANLDPRLEQAARNLGASVAQTVRLVIVPCIMPGILAGAIFAFVHAWDELVVLLFITSRRLYLLPRAMWAGINENVDPTIAAVATLLMLATLGGLLIQRGVRLRAARTPAPEAPLPAREPATLA
ncbi:MAG: ABC transporter permease [Candidatus Rokubacteria bacterium]|nr:ABC transporter permease [Candidatus Rokubacteria bacterium]